MSKMQMDRRTDRQMDRRTDGFSALYSRFLVLISAVISIHIVFDNDKIIVTEFLVVLHHSFVKYTLELKHTFVRRLH